MKNSWFSILLACAAMYAAVSASADSAAAATWIDSGIILGAEGNVSFHAEWNPESPIDFRIADEGGVGIVVSLGPAACTVRSDSVGSESGASPFPFDPVLSAWPQQLPGMRIDSARFEILFRPTYWSFFCENREILRIPPALHNPKTVEIRGTVPGKVRFQKTAAIYFHDDFQVPENEEDPLPNWEVVSGEWAVHTALEDAIEQETSDRLDRRPLEADRSPNFYSLSGHGRPGRIVAGNGFYNDYRLRAALCLQPGSGPAGIMFLMRGETDYFMFTATERTQGKTVLRLERRRPDDSRPETLGGVEADIHSGQWILLEVRLSPGRIRCLVDATEIFDVEVPLPSGGRFGLYVDSPNPVRFDDVTVQSNWEPDLSTPDAIRFHSIHVEGDAYKTPSFWENLLGKGDPGFGIFRSGTETDRTLIVRPVPPEDAIFSATFHSSVDSDGFGLVFGWKSPGEPGFLFHVDRVGWWKTRVRILPNRQTEAIADTPVIAEWILNRRCRQNPVRLAVRVSESGFVRAYCCDQIVLVHQFAPEDLRGFFGVRVLPGANAPVSELAMRSDDVADACDREEKNMAFVSDPFMRHWASPEGNWVPPFEIRNPRFDASVSKDAFDRTAYRGDFIHKSDFFSGFSLTLPLVDRTTVGLGHDPENNRDDVTLRIHEDRLLIADHRSDATTLDVPLALLFPEPGLEGYLAKTRYATEEKPRPGVPLPPKDPNRYRLYDLHVEGNWLWLTRNGTMIAAQPLAAPLTGTRIRVNGFNTDALSYSRSVRSNVKDFTFSEAPYEWFTHGGKWQVINRFECDPRWSHMNGESEDGLADIWSKYRFGGRFCLEIYAGPRHGWYNRVGDLNTTILNQEPTPGSGWTFICGGWDRNWTQTTSTCLFDGEIRQTSDAYLTPRRRDKNVRKNLDPFLIEQKDRDVHGAWYYINVRNDGNGQIEYSFDNETVFREPDSGNAQEGGLGIWTYANSMMVARVKVHADTIRRKPVVFRPLAQSEIMESPTVGSETRTRPDSSDPVITVNGIAVLNMEQEWRVEPDAGRNDLRFFEGTDSEPVSFESVKHFEGGRFSVLHCGKPIPRNAVVGWEFRFTQSPGTLVNFHFETGHTDASGLFEADQHDFHRLTGPKDETDGFVCVGETEIPESGMGNTELSARSAQVSVFLPPQERESERKKGRKDKDRTAAVRIRGFGLFHPGHIAMGLAPGNPPGSAYRIIEFSPILTDFPKIDIRLNTGNITVHLEEEKDNHVFPDCYAANEWLRANSRPGINRAHVSVSGFSFPIRWLHLPEPIPPLSLSWSRTTPYTIRVESAEAVPDSRLTQLNFTVQGIQAPLEPVGPHAVEARLPFGTLAENNQKLSASELEIILTAPNDALSRKQVLRQSDHPFHPPPLFVGFECGPFETVNTFETVTLTDARPQSEKPIQLIIEKKKQIQPVPRKDIPATRVLSRPDGNRHLRSINSRVDQRLITPIRRAVSLSRHPLFYFRYRGDENTLVSLLADHDAIVSFSEKGDFATDVRLRTPPELDGHWHEWIGNVSAAFREFPLEPPPFSVASVTFASLSEYDMTGKNAFLELDDVGFGPAVSESNQIMCTPVFFTLNPPVSVSYRLRPQILESFPGSSLVSKTEPAWLPANPDGSIAPDLSNLEEGLCLLELRARDAQGAESVITSLPFLIDRTPFSMAWRFTGSSPVTSNGTMLEIVAESPNTARLQAPIDMERMKFSFRNRDWSPISPESRLLHTPGKEKILLNWPYFLRDAIQEMADGDESILTVSGIQDGANNRSPDLEIPIKMVFSSDRTPPTLLAPELPKSLISCLGFPDSEASLPYLDLKAFRGRPILEANDDTPCYLFGCRRDLDYFTLRFPEIEQPGKDDRRILLEDYPCIAIRHQFRKNKDQSTHLVLNIAFDNGKNLVIDPVADNGAPQYGDPDRERNRRSLPQPAWWRTAWIDVRQLYEKTFAGETPEISIGDIGFATITVLNGNTDFRPQLFISNFDLIGPGHTGDAVVFHGYDRSGLAGIDWSFKDQSRIRSDSGTIEGQRLPLRIGDEITDAPGWYEVRLRDRAGNRSRPWFVPCIR